MILRLLMFFVLRASLSEQVMNTIVKRDKFMMKETVALSELLSNTKRFQSCCPPPREAVCNLAAAVADVVS